MLRDTAGLCDQHDGEIVCRRFVSECFGRFGQNIARAVTGELTKDRLVDNSDVEGAFRAAIKLVSLTDDAVVSLKERCNRFLRSTEPDDEELKFRLTQGYYVAQLLEFNNNDFNPIAEDAFRDALFYIDTNVVIEKLLSNNKAHLLDELVQISKYLGIRLCVSRATIEEAQRVASSRLDGLDRVLASVSPELVNRTQDSFLSAFMELRQNNPTLTPEDYLLQFDEIPILLSDLGIELYDATLEEIVGDHDLSQECGIIGKVAEKIRFKPKTPTATLHDAGHYLLVQHERQHGRKAWFLTQDKTLSQAANELDSEKLPFCFPLVGFLQSVSPFLEAQDAQRSLVDLFSAVLSGEVGDLSGDNLFDLQELKLISELHTDVLSTPDEQLIPAFDYVKNTVLGGKPYLKDNHPLVALELKKFLSSSAEEKQQTLQDEIIRQQRVVDEERAKRKLAEEDAKNKADELSRLEATIEEVQREQLASQEQMKKEKNEAIAQWRDRLSDALSRSIESSRSERQLSAILVLGGAALTYLVWSFDSELAVVIRRYFGFENNIDSRIQTGIQIAGSAILFGSSYPLARRIKPVHCISLLATICALTFARLDLFGSIQIANIAGYLVIATPIAYALSVVFGWSKVIDCDTN